MNLSKATLGTLQRELGMQKSFVATPRFRGPMRGIPDAAPPGCYRACELSYTREESGLHGPQAPLSSQLATQLRT